MATRQWSQRNSDLLMRHGSDSKAQLTAERHILAGLQRMIGEPLGPKRLNLPSGPYVDVDAVSADRSVLVEIFAHQGTLKGGQRHKIAGDALKLITLAHGQDPRPRLILAFADQQLAHWAAGKSWLAASLALWKVEVIVVELPADIRSQVVAAQARQVMVNPPATLGAES